MREIRSVMTYSKQSCGGESNPQNTWFQLNGSKISCPQEYILLQFLTFRRSYPVSCPIRCFRACRVVVEHVLCSTSPGRCTNRIFHAAGSWSLPKISFSAFRLSAYRMRRGAVRHERAIGVFRRLVHTPPVVAIPLMYLTASAVPA